LQTWPAKFNEQFKSSFTITSHNPDTQHFDDDALKEFTKVMRDLFNVKENATDLPIHFAHKTTNNTRRSYVGVGENIMALLRLSQGIREDLKITELIEPDGFACEWKDGKDHTGIKNFHMDISKEYCLYTKVGWETMACVKPKFQFDTECNFNDPGVDARDVDLCKPDKSPPEGETAYPMDIDWFSGEAFFYCLRSAIFVWACAFLTVILRGVGSYAGWEWVNSPALLTVSAFVAVAWGVVADMRAMRWVLVPWLQKIGRPKVMTISLPFHAFLALKLCGTAVQIVTIQTNAWFMVNAVEINDRILKEWIYKWSNSMFSAFLPDSVWGSVFTPKTTAILLWVLSTFQLLQPLVVGTPWDSKDDQEESSRRLLRAQGYSPFPAREQYVLLLQENNGSENQFCPKKSSQGFYHDFLTYWGRLCQVLGSKPRKYTFRESVAMMAIASGLRYIGSTSISYPQALIKEITKYQRGYKIYTEVGQGQFAYEPMSQGWEMKSLKEFQKLSRTFLRRMTYIMLFKLGAQMNLQITLFVIANMRMYDKSFITVLKSGEMSSSEVSSAAAGIVSIMSLMITFMTELYDSILILQIFFLLRALVQEKVTNIGADEHYAYDDFESDKTKQNQRVPYDGNALKEEYNSARCDAILMVVFILFCTFLVGYALLKFVASSLCEYGAWELASGCLKELESK